MLVRFASAAMLCAALAAPASAQVLTYGSGCNDVAGPVPTLGASLFGAPVGGSILTVSVGNAVPSSSFLLFVGLGQAQIPVGYGCDLLMPGIVALVSLPLDPSGALTFPATMPSVPVTFTFTMQAFCIDPGTQLGATTTNGAQVTLNPNPAPVGLVINEVDYDQPATDTTEFIEIYNPTANPISLSGISLALVNGSNNLSYQVLDLTSLGSLPAGAYLVAGQAGALALVPGGTMTLTLPVVAGGTVQNGSPDGIAIVDITNQLVIDALSYEGAMTSVTITGLTNPVSLVEGTATGAQEVTPFTLSLARFPNANDSNNAIDDWVLSATPTPGTANGP